MCVHVMYVYLIFLEKITSDLYCIKLQIMSVPEPSFPPPPPPMSLPPSAPSYDASSNGYTNGPYDSGGGVPGSGSGDMVQAQPSVEEWDDDWDSDDGESSNSTVGTSGAQVCTRRLSWRVHQDIQSFSVFVYACSESDTQLGFWFLRSH